MFEFGARFSNDFYIKVALDETDPNENTVTVETVIEGEPVVVTGAITWDDSEDDGDGDGDGDGLS